MQPELKPLALFGQQDPRLRLNKCKPLIQRVAFIPALIAGNSRILAVFDEGLKIRKRQRLNAEALGDQGIEHA